MVRVADVLIGAVFGRLTVVGHTRKPVLVNPKSPGHTRHFTLCVCECGASATVETSSLGLRTLSCGCARIDAITKHGMYGTTTYITWRDMVQRTTSPDCIDYMHYKDRAPPKEWLKFENFLADMGEQPKGLTLDRIDNDLPYSKDNCRWATWQEQNDNKSDSVRVSYSGRLWTVAELAKHGKMSYYLLHRRLSKRWTVDEALNLPAFSRPTQLLPTSALIKLYPTT